MTQEKTDQAAPERATIMIWAKPSRHEITQWANSALRNSEIEYIDEALIEDFADGLSALCADLAAPSAPAEVEGLVERLSNAGHGGSIVPNPRMCREAATALTALQADKAALIEARDMMGRLWEQEKARAEKAEGERDAWKANAVALADSIYAVYPDERAESALTAHEELTGEV